MAIGEQGLDRDLPELVAIIESLGGRAGSAGVAAAMGPSASPHSVGRRLAQAARRRWVHVRSEGGRSVWEITAEGRTMLQGRRSTV